MGYISEAIMQEFKLTQVTIRYKDLGTGFPVVFVHGTPGSSDEFLSVMTELQENYRVIAPDHIGFGQSDKPENYPYTIQNHQDNFSQFMVHLNLKQFHIVVHDFGGIIALPYIIKHINNVSSLIIMNSWAWPMSQVEYFPPWMKKIMSSSFMKYLYLKRNFSANYFVKSAWGKYSKLTKEKHIIYKEKFKSPQDRLGTWGFAQSLVNEESDVWKIENQLQILSQIPVTLLWGGADKLITLKSFERWRKILPHTKTKVLENVGHFLADEAPEIVVKELQEIFKT